MKFLSPFNLIYLSLALIPIIIHFLSKFKNREIYFPTVKLFKTILKHEIGKLRIKEILHLILRTLALTLLLLTFSKPQIADSNNSANEINLIIDNSYSMEPVKGKIIHSLHNINAKVINLYLLSGEKKRFFSKKSLIDYVRENISTYGSFTLNSLTGKLDTSIKTSSPKNN